MAVSHRPFGQPRLGLEPLEAREVPAIVFVGGWGSSVSPHVDPDAPNVVYVGGSNRSVGSVGKVTGVSADPADPRSHAVSGGFPRDIRRVDAGSQAGKHGGVLDIRDSRALGHISRDQFVFGVEFPSASGPGSLGIDVHSVRAAALRSTTPTSPGLDLLGPTVTKSGEVLLEDGDMYFVLVTSHAPPGPGSLGVEGNVVRSADPLPVLLVIADQRDFYHSTDGGVGDGRSPALRKGGWVMDVTIPPSADGRVTDDVVVDGRIITGEYSGSASVAATGHIRITKLNSGG